MFRTSTHICVTLHILQPRKSRRGLLYTAAKPLTTGARRHGTALAQLHDTIIHSAELNAQAFCTMLDHLLELQEAQFLPDIMPNAFAPAGFVPAERLKAAQQFDAKVATVDLFTKLGVVDDESVVDAVNKESSDAFVALIGTDEDKALEAVGALSLPTSVRASVAMLTNYQWDFVAQAKELRSMAVSKIVAETDHPDAKIRLNALRMLGNVTEVALFTERVEVKKTDMTPDAIEQAIREKLQKFARALPQNSTEIEDAVAKEPSSDKQ